MQNTRKRLLFSTLTGLTLCVTLTARMTSAQGPGDPQGQGEPDGISDGSSPTGYGVGRL